MRDLGLNRTERRRRALRTLSRVLEPVLNRVPREVRRDWRVWFYVQERSIGASRRAAWRAAGESLRLGRLLRATPGFKEWAEQVTREAA